MMSLIIKKESLLLGENETASPVIPEENLLSDLAQSSFDCSQDVFQNSILRDSNPSEIVASKGSTHESSNKKSSLIQKKKKIDPIPCVICDEYLPSVFKYHKHNIQKHTVSQLSVALLKFRNLPLPHYDPIVKEDEKEDEEEEDEEEDDNEEEENVGEEGVPSEKEALEGLPMKVEPADFEVIELGPTEDANNLMIKSRQYTNKSRGRQPLQRHVIELNADPVLNTPWYIKPVGGDPAIVVRFGRDGVLASNEVNELNKFITVTPKKPRGAVRAVAKSVIEIPNLSNYTLDNTSSERFVNSNKYVMRHVSLMQDAPKRKRGRPRKEEVMRRRAEEQARLLEAEEDVFDDDDDEAALADLIDPPLLSEDEAEEATASLPSVTRTRSGRKVKRKQEDEDYKYYDVSGPDLLESKPWAQQKEWKMRDETELQTIKGRRGRKRKHLLVASVSTEDKNSSESQLDMAMQEVESMDLNVKIENDELNMEDHDTEEGLSMPTVDMFTEENVTIPKEEKVADGVTNSCKINTTSDGNIQRVSGSEDNEKSAEELEQHETQLSKSESLTSDPAKHMDSEGCTNSIGTIKMKGRDTGSSVSVPLSVGEDGIMGEETSSDEDAMSFTDSDDEIFEVKSSGSGFRHKVSRSERMTDRKEQIKNCDTKQSEKSNKLSKRDVPFTCGMCDINFVSKKELKTHQLAEHKSDCFSCAKCGKQYQTKVALQIHFKKYHLDREWMKYKCATCGMDFGFLSALERHMKEHNPNQKFCCEQCGKVFKTLNNLKTHIPLHTKEELYKCSYCPKEYYIRYSYEKHMKAHLEAPRYHCQVCNKNFTERRHFQIHIKRHQVGGSLGMSKDLRCNNCGDTKLPNELEKLTQGDSGYHKACIACGKGLYKKYQIENPRIKAPRQSEDRTREQCTICGKWVLNLQRHVKSTHINNEVVACELCGIFVTKASLPSHKNRKHSGTQVTCDHCNKIFKNIMCLQEHMNKVRKRQEPVVKCRVCGKTVGSDYFKEHMAAHQMLCNACGTSNFENQDAFISHLEVCADMQVDVIAASLTDPETASQQEEVVTSILAIVDESLICHTCGEAFPDQDTLVNHITEAHPETLATTDVHVLEEDMIYACPVTCPVSSCEKIISNRDLLREHLLNDHDAQVVS